MKKLNNKIYLNNLSVSVTAKLLKDHFAKCGEIAEINLPLDPKTQQPKGYAFISFTEVDAVESALQYDGKPFMDKDIVVQVAIEKPAKKKK